MKANVPKPLSPKLQAQIAEQILQDTGIRFKQVSQRLHDIDLMIMLMALNRRGYGHKRLQRFMDDFMQVAEEYGNEYDEAMYEALKLHLKQSGFELKG